MRAEPAPWMPEGDRELHGQLAALGQGDVGRGLDELLRMERARLERSVRP